MDVLLISFIILSFLPFCYGIREQKFYASVLCDLETRLAKKCSKHVVAVRKTHACISGCAKDFQCVGVSVFNKTECFHHYPCSSIKKCKTKEIQHKYLSKNCAHGGVWNPEKLFCACTDAWVGENCLDLPSVCNDLYKSGQTKRIRAYLVLNNSSSNSEDKLFPVVCYASRESGSSTVGVFRNFGGGDFDNRTWSEYRHGFYVSFNNFWIGLENWHALSEEGYTTLNVFLNVSKRYRIYRDFEMKAEFHNFSFRFAETFELQKREGLLEDKFDDCFGSLQNVPFSTRDKDNDGVSDNNCAERVGGGWWFHQTCTSACNLLGRPPRYWRRYPEDQWLRVGGTDPNHLKEQQKKWGVGSEARIKKDG